MERLSNKEPVTISAEAWLKGVQQHLVADGHRMTAARQAILKWIAETSAPFTAETLVSDLVKQQHLSSRPTIYRTVDWLRTSGWIARLQSDGQDHTYARLLPGHYHHAVCTVCGATLIVAGCEALRSISTALAQQGFEVQGHLLELYGLCANCRAAESPSS